MVWLAIALLWVPITLLWIWCQRLEGGVAWTKGCSEGNANSIAAILEAIGVDEVGNFKPSKERELPNLFERFAIMTAANEFILKSIGTNHHEPKPGKTSPTAFEMIESSQEDIACLQSALEALRVRVANLSDVVEPKHAIRPIPENGQPDKKPARKGART